MIVVRQWAGLGNQMFIYAYYRALQEQGKSVKIDTSYFNVFEVHGGKYKIPEIFSNTRNVYASSEECSRYANYKMTNLHRVLRKLGIDKKTHIIQIKKYGDYGFIPQLLRVKEGYMEGYYQSEKYFSSIKDKIRKEFQFTAIPDQYPNEYKAQIISSSAVSIHIRRGDYLAVAEQMLCNTDYYDNAFTYINEHVKNPAYYVFSDDIPWCKEFFRSRPEKLIYVQQRTPAYFDMYLMSLCHHNIIADSSFSWWGAWLNNHKDKIVCAPQKWLISGNIETTDIIPVNWIKI